MHRLLLVLLVPACTESESDTELRGEYNFGDCELFEPAPGSQPNCDAPETVTTVCGARGNGFMPVQSTFWSQTHCQGIIHFGTLITGPTFSFGFAGATTYDVVEDDEIQCPVGGVVALGPPEAARLAEVHDGDSVGTGTLVLETGGTLDARFTRGFADVTFDDGRHLVAKFIAPFCGPTE